MAEAVLGVTVGDRAEFGKTVTAEDVARFADGTRDPHFSSTGLRAWPGRHFSDKTPWVTIPLAAQKGEP